MRLEQENDDLAHELVTSKIALRDELDTVSKYMMYLLICISGHTFSKSKSQFIATYNYKGFVVATTCRHHM